LLKHNKLKTNQEALVQLTFTSDRST